MNMLKLVFVALAVFLAGLISCSEDRAQPERSMDMDLKPMGETVRFHDTSEYLDKLKSTLRETEDSVLTGLPPDFLEGAVIQFHKEKLDPRINLPVEARPFGQ